MISTKRTSKLGLMAALAALAALVVGPAVAASASTYQDLYSKDCGTQVVQIKDNSRGYVTHHFRNGSITAVLNNKTTSTYYSHTSAPLSYKSVKTSSVETGGADAKVKSALLTCV